MIRNFKQKDLSDGQTLLLKCHKYKLMMLTYLAKNILCKMLVSDSLLGKYSSRLTVP